MAPAASDKLLLRLQFQEPLAGNAEDLLHMPSSDTLHVDSTVCVHGKTVKYRQVFHRRS